MDMNKYLIDKVMEIKKRMGGGDVGALSALTEAMQPQQPSIIEWSFRCEYFYGPQPQQPMPMPMPQQSA
jgi:hypothetical protein